MRGRLEARELELNHAIVELGRTDVLLANLSLGILLMESVGKYYSDEVVLWFQNNLIQGKETVFQHVACTIEPIHTLLEMGLASVASFRVMAAREGVQSELSTDWELVLSGHHSTEVPLRWRCTRVWKERVVVAERIRSLR
jgi:hypothetical protein